MAGCLILPHPPRVVHFNSYPSSKSTSSSLLLELLVRPIFLLATNTLAPRQFLDNLRHLHCLRPGRFFILFLRQCVQASEKPYGEVAVAAPGIGVALVVDGVAELLYTGWGVVLSLFRSRQVLIHVCA
ncbi:hypothetical protein HBI66_179190 [Parastagonospora nodorum]|nr:hypothetical protein HBI66_179190 [Parastagonospora nodorum]